MNKYEEALKNIKHSLFVNGAMGYVDEINVIEELIEKATPKKVIKLKLEPSTNEEYETWWEEYEYRCPNCDYDVHNNYCDNCGQALDWSEEE